MTDSAEGLVVNSIAKSFGKRQVVRDVSLSLQRGEIVGLLGPNGAGKTTCFYMIMGLIGADSGSISIDGEDVTRLPMYQRARLGVGYLPQEASIFRGMTVEENVMAVAELVEKDRAKRMAQVDSLLSELHVEHLCGQAATSLSGGERRRVEIARSLCMDPDFILLDEPFAGVDPIAVEDIQGIVRELKEKEIGVLITDHNVRETLSITNRSYLLFDGQILKSGTSEFLANDEEARRLYLGEKFKLD